MLQKLQLGQGRCYVSTNGATGTREATVLVLNVVKVYLHSLGGGGAQVLWKELMDKDPQ